MLQKIESIIHKITKALSWVSCLGVLIVTIFTMISVFMRYILHAPIQGSTEMVECMMVITVFASLAYTQAEKGHVSISMILRILPSSLAMILNTINHLIVTAFSGYITYALYFQMQYAVKKHLTTALALIPHAPFYLVACISMVLLTVVFALDTINACIAIWNKEYADRVKSFWT